MFQSSYAINEITFIDDYVGYVAAGTRYTGGALYKTTNGGNSWKEIYNNSGNAVYDVFFLNDSVGYACGEWYLLLKTIDGGKTWTQIHLFTGLVQQNVWYNLQSIAFGDEMNGVVVGGQNFTNGIIAYTTDGGQTWETSFIDNELRDIDFIGPQKALVSGYGLVLNYNSNDYQPMDLKSDYFTGIESYNDYSYLCGYNGGIYQSTDQQTWKIINPSNKLIGKRSHFNDLAVINDETILVAGSNGLLLSSSNQTDWEKINLNIESNLLSISYINNTLLVGDSEGNVYRIKR